MPKIEKYGKGWSFRLRVPDPVTGIKTLKRFSGYPTEEVAEIAALEEEARIKKGINADAGGHTVETWLEYWYENIVGHRIEKTTANKYKNSMKKIVAVIGSIPVDKIKPTAIQTMVSVWSKKYKPSTVHADFEPLRAALNDAVKQDIVYRNPCNGVALPKLTYTEKVILNKEQLRALLEAAKDTQLYLPALLAALLGLRRSEVAGLKWDNVDIENKAVYITNARVSGDELKETKTPKGKRRISMPDELAVVMKEYWDIRPDDTDYVCLVNGKPMRPDYMTLALSRLAQRLGLPKVSPHGLRHSHATILMLLRVHPKIVQERLGHSRISITLDRYSHAVDSMQDEAAKLFGTSVLGVGVTKTVTKTEVQG